MDNEKIIRETVLFVKKELEGKESGHDWWHIYRVWNTAKKIALVEGADLFIVELAALLHDIADRKLNNGDEQLGLRRVRTYLTSCIDDTTLVNTILHIIETYSYTSQLKSGKGMDTLEGKIVQDADRLDALGAIGIARTFNYGGHAGRPLFDPSKHAQKNISASQYVNSLSPSINHFYEKLLLLKDLMNTKTAKKIAEERHMYMEGFLRQFYKEWNGEDIV